MLSRTSRAFHPMADRHLYQDLPYMVSGCRKTVACLSILSEHQHHASLVRNFQVILFSHDNFLRNTIALLFRALARMDRLQSLGITTHGAGTGRIGLLEALHPEARLSTLCLALRELDTTQLVQWLTSRPSITSLSITSLPHTFVLPRSVLPNLHSVKGEAIVLQGIVCGRPVREVTVWLQGPLRTMVTLRSSTVIQKLVLQGLLMAPPECETIQELLECFLVVAPQISSLTINVGIKQPFNNQVTKF